MDAQLGCVVCGRMDSSVRAMEFHKAGQEVIKGSWCPRHRLVRRLSTLAITLPRDIPYVRLITASLIRERAFIQGPGTNADLLGSIAIELRKRGEVREAEKAEKLSSQFQNKVDRALKELESETYYRETRNR